MSVASGRGKLPTALLALSAASWAVVLPLYAYKVYLKTDYTDFEVYYRSAARLRDGNWTDVYSLGDGASPFRYIPLTLPLFRPFASFSYETAKVIWFFLQYAWFIAGFVLLHRVMKLTRTRHPATVAALASLFVLRFSLDCFTIGQVSSLLFLFFAASFAAWSLRRPSQGALALTVPALFKIGPGILLPLFLKGRPRERIRAFLAPVFLLGAWLAGLWIWIAFQAAGVFHAPTLVIWNNLWRTWMVAVAKDSEYFDAAHYGSQSIKSFLLRLVQSGWLSNGNAMLIYGALAFLICSTVLGFWLLRQPKGIRGRTYFFAIGIFPYLWVMPETFKYTLTVLAIPVALLLDESTRPSRPRFTQFALVFGTLTLALAGKDLVGDTLFFGSQKASLPLLSTFFLGIATLRHACMNSKPSRFSKTVRLLLGDQRLEPWLPAEALPALEASAPGENLNSSDPHCTLIVPIPMFADRALDLELIERILVQTDELLSAHAKMEIMLEPFGDRVSFEHPVWISLEALSARRGWVFAGSGNIQATSSLALRHSFPRSRGKWILILQADQPADPSFFLNALGAIKLSESAGKPLSLVRGNRRLAESRFRIPVKLLKLVYRRHRLGLYFNRLVRWVLPITTTDTHSRMLVMDRWLAREAFTLQGSKDFLFDLELSLVAQSHGFREMDLPVTLYLATEKTPTRMAWETVSIFLGLPALAWRNHRGFYQRPTPASPRFTADDWGISPEVNRGILDLARAGVVKRVSMMANSGFLDSELTELRKVGGVELGLHFDLTFKKARPRDVLRQWILPSQATKKAVILEFERQVEVLKHHGAPPAYLDGHHHIHLVPGILRTLAPSIRAAGIRTIRVPYDPGLWLTRLSVLNVLALLAKSSLKKYGFNSLPCFYPNAAYFMDLGRFRASLATRSRSEVIVHPARANDFKARGVLDPYTDGRVREYRALLMLAPQADSPK